MMRTIAIETAMISVTKNTTAMNTVTVYFAMSHGSDMEGRL